MPRLRVVEALTDMQLRIFYRPPAIDPVAHLLLLLLLFHVHVLALSTRPLDLHLCCPLSDRDHHSPGHRPCPSIGHGHDPRTSEQP